MSHRRKEMDLSKEEQHILLHSLGLSHLRWYEKDKLLDEPYRNRFYTSKKTKDYTFIESLISKGLMFNTQKGWDGSGSTYFVVTDEGINIAKSIATKQVRENKPSRSKMRYELYLHADCDETFGEWLKNKYWNDYRKRHGC